MNETTNSRPLGRAACWIALALLVVPMFGSYFFDDMFSTVSNIFADPSLLQLGWGQDEYGKYTSGYSILCIFGGLVLCGMLLDKWGVRITGSIFVGLMVAGAAMVTWAITSGLPARQSLNVAWAGCMVFGLGSEIAGVAVTRSIAKWFKERNMAFAMGLQLAIARLGTATAFLLSPVLIREKTGVYTLAETARPAFVGLVLLLVGAIFWAVFVAMDARFDRSRPAPSRRPAPSGPTPSAPSSAASSVSCHSERSEESASGPASPAASSTSDPTPSTASSAACHSERSEESASGPASPGASSTSDPTPSAASSAACHSERSEESASDSAGSPDEEKFRFSDVLKVLGNRNWWLLALLCVFFYSSIVAFKKFSGAILVPRFGVSSQAAGFMATILPFSTVIFAPLFGLMVDRRGNGTRWMLFGALLALAAHLLIGFAPSGKPFFGYLSMILLGFSYSLVPAAMWPSVPRVIPDKMLGTAYALIYWVQNLGLWAFKRFAGHLLGGSVPAPAVAPGSLSSGSLDTLSQGSSSVLHEGLSGAGLSPVLTTELMFVCVCVAALVLAWLFMRSSRRNPSLGLDAPNR